MAAIVKRVEFPRGDASGLDLIKEARAELAAYEGDVNNLRQAELDAAAATDALNTRISGGNASLSRASGAVERLSNALGGTLAGAVLGVAGDVSDLSEAMGAKGKGLGGVITAMQSPIGAAVGGIGLLTLGISLLTKEYERQQQIARDTANAIQRETEARFDFYQTLDAEGAAAASTLLEQNKRETARLENTRAAYQREIDQLEARNAELRQESTLGLSPSERVARKAELNENNIKIAEFQQRITEATGAIETLEDSLGLMEGVVLAIRTAIESAEVESTQTVERTLSTVVDMAGKIGNTTRIIFDTVLQIVTENADLAAEKFDAWYTKQVDAQTAATENAAAVGEKRLHGLADAIERAGDAAQDAEKAFNDLQSDVQKTVDRLDAQRGQLATSLNETLTTLNQSILDAQRDASADILDEQTRFHASQADIMSTFQRESNRAEVDFRREQERIRRSAMIDERRAVAANDILEVLEIRERKKEELRQNREDYSLQKQRREEDLQLRLQAEKVAHDARVLAIEQARDAEIAAINDRIKAAQDAHAVQIAEIERQRQAAIDAITAVAQARQAADDAAIAGASRVKQAWQQVAYPGGPTVPAWQQLFGNQQSPLDPFNLGGTPTSPVIPLPSPGGGGGGGGNIVFAQGAITVGDVASKEDIRDAIRQAVVPAIIQARRAAYGT